jgi:hypothetical protein
MLLSWVGWIFADACSVYDARANGLKYDKMETPGPNPKRRWNWTHTHLGLSPVRRILDIEALAGLLSSDFGKANDFSAECCAQQCAFFSTTLASFSGEI